MRVATNSREPLITRVVIDLARKIPYTIETVGEESRVLFTRAVDASAATAAIVTPVSTVVNFGRVFRGAGKKTLLKRKEIDINTKTLGERKKKTKMKYIVYS